MGLVSLGQPACARTDRGFSVTPGNGTEQGKKELSPALWCYQQRLLGLVRPAARGMRGQGDICNHAEQAGGWGWAGVRRDHGALPEGDLGAPQPCPPHLSLYSPHPFPLPLRRSVFFRPSLFGNDAKCCPQVIEQISIPQPSPYFQCVACRSFLSLFRRSAYS